MEPGKKQKVIKTIKIDVDKCNGCRACEMICSSFHSVPKYSSNNPARSRIRVIRDPMRDVYVPVYAGEYAAAECMGRDKYIIGGKEYDECAFPAGLPAPPEKPLKSLTPPCLSNATCARARTNRSV